MILRSIESSTETRIEWLDALKGVGILLVMLCHAGLLSSYGVFLTAGFMSLFFIAAGYTYNERLSASAIVKKRFVRLILPYLFYGSLTIVIFICYVCGGG